MNKNHKDSMEIKIMEAFTSMKSYQEIGMPNVEEELAKLMARKNRRRVVFFRKMAASIAFAVAICGIAVAAIVNHGAIPSFFFGKTNSIAEEKQMRISNDLTIIPSDTVTVTSGVVMFENSELADIMLSISNAYKKEVVFKNEELKHVHLHFQYKTEDKLELVLQSLNMFEKINVKLNDDKLEVE